MKIRLTALAFFPIITAVLIAASPENNRADIKAAFRRPTIPPGETLIYRVTEKSRGMSFIPPTKVIQSEHHLQMVDARDGSRIIRHICREIRKDGVALRWEFDYLDAVTGVQALGYVLEKLSPEKDTYYYEESVFDEPILKLPPDIVHVLSVPFLLSGIDFAPDKRFSMHIWTEEGKPARILMNVCGSERVKVPWKTVETWKICIRIDNKSMPKFGGALAKVIANLLPKFTIWFEKNPPHRPVKLHGVFGPLTPGKPEIIHELIKVVSRKSPL